MPAENLERHLLAGLDERQRGFSRQVEIEFATESYRASLQYEKLLVAGDPHPTREAALLALVQRLHTRGYRQLRSRLSFRGTEYFGSLEPWVEYSDPEPPAQSRGRLVARLERLWYALFPR